MNETLVVVFSGVVALSTVVYAVLTWRLVCETREMRQVQTEPRVSVRVALDHINRGLELVICNEGQGAAKDVRFTFEGDTTYVTGPLHPKRCLPADIAVIKNGLHFLEPGEIHRFPLGQRRNDSTSLGSWTFRTQYENLSGKPKKDTYVVDFSEFDWMFFDEIPAVQIARHLDSIRKDMHRLTEGYAKVHAVTQTREEFLKEREDHLRPYETGTVDTTTSSDEDE